MKVKKDYEKKHSTVLVKRRAESRMVIADVKIETALKLLGDKPKYENDIEGFTIVSADGESRFKEDIFNELDVENLKKSCEAVDKSSSQAQKTSRTKSTR